MTYTYIDENCEQIELIEFETPEEKLRFIGAVSEIAWGDSGLGIEDDVPQREPVSSAETIKRLEDFAKFSFAWQALAMKVGAEPFAPPHTDDDSDFNMDVRELMERILKEIDGQ